AFALATCRQAAPSVDTEPITVVPLRDNFNHAGSVVAVLVTLVVAAPFAGRVLNSMPPPGVTSRRTCAASAAADLPGVRPALARALVFCTDVTRTTTCVLGCAGCETNWNESFVPPMSAPPPLMVNTSFATVAVPDGNGCPMSTLLHGAGRIGDGADSTNVRKFTFAMPLVPAATNTRRMLCSPAEMTMPSLRMVVHDCHPPV